MVKCDNHFTIYICIYMLNHCIVYLKLIKFTYQLYFNKTEGKKVTQGKSSEISQKISCKFFIGFSFSVYYIYSQNGRKHSTYLAQKECSVTSTGALCHIAYCCVYKACMIALVQSSYMLEIFKRILIQELNTTLSSSDLKNSSSSFIPM